MVRLRPMAAARVRPPSAVAAAGLIGGFAAARYSHRRSAGGALFGLAWVWCSRSWWRATGPAPAGALGVLYPAAMGVSHPLARRIGAWPAVGVVTALVVAASEVVTRRPRYRKPG